MATRAPSARDRTVLFVSMPVLWPTWPFLPMIRRNRGEEELGVMFDSRAARLTGYSSTVFFANLLMLPRRLDQFLVLPHETFDSAEELADAGWCVD